MIIYCLIYYRLLGVITILSLVLSFGLVYAILVLLGRWVGYSLDMAGVAGLIIAIGITADSFVIYFERIKDEVREGRTFRSAVPRGWQRAKRTILSADAVSFLSAAILYVLAVGEVKGFAFTLGLSTVLDLVVVFLVTHPLVASGGRFAAVRLAALVRAGRRGQGRAPSSELRTPGSAPRRRRRCRYDHRQKRSHGDDGATPAEPAGRRRRQRRGHAAAATPPPDKQYGRQAGFLSRLTTGTGAFNILGRRKVYYIVSGTLVVASILLIVFRGFQFGIDFAGGTTLQFQPNAGETVSTTEVAQVVTSATGVEPDAVQTVGTQIQVSSSTLTVDQVIAAKGAINSAYAPAGGVSDSAVSETWGSEISQRALLAVVVFLVAVAAFLWIRYEKRMAVGAVVSVLHDLIITAGIYSLVGFEVTPATVIGLLTILGFSLYDTVVVYDKVQENTKGLTSLNRRTYPEAANLAVNQTLMRSINTSLIALLPVAGLLVAGVVILGSGTLKDLSLVMLIGMLVGAYSSVFIAVPVAVDLKLRDPPIKAHTARVTAKRKAEGLVVDADGDPIRRIGVRRRAPSGRPRLRGARARRRWPPRRRRWSSGLKPGAAPKPGVKPVRPTAKPAATGGARPSGKGGRPLRQAGPVTGVPAAASAGRRPPPVTPRPGSPRAGAAIDRLVRTQQDFPQPGVLFRDLTPVLADAGRCVTSLGALAAAAPDATLDRRAWSPGASCSVLPRR